MKTQHTPGPWATRESATHVTVTNARGDAVFHDDKRIPGVMADARLIAAAPELLEACLAHQGMQTTKRLFCVCIPIDRQCHVDIWRLCHETLSKHVDR